MNGSILIKTYEKMGVDIDQIMRYAGCRGGDNASAELAAQCVTEAEGCFSYKVCYSLLDCRICGDVCDFGVFSVRSKALSANLKGCERVALFAATVGIGIDRLIGKYSRLSPAKALFFQAIGAQQIEALCDTFCAEIEDNSRPRFSPGYGDLPLNIQQDIFDILGCEKAIGLTLNSSLLMSPTKSVTAFLGLGGK